MPATPLVPRRFSLSSSSQPDPDSQADAARLEAESTRKLQRIVDSALSHLELGALLDELVARIQEVLEVDTCVILLVDEARHELVATAARGLEEEVERGVRIPLGRGFAGRVASERQPVVLDDLEHADIVNPLLREKGLQALLGAPLLARGEVLGVVHVGSLEPREFSLAD